MNVVQIGVQLIDKYILWMDLLLLYSMAKTTKDIYINFTITSSCPH